MEKMTWKLIQKAKKSHNCDCCENWIRSGKSYYRFTLFGEEIEHAKICPRCYSEFFDPHWFSYLSVYTSSLEDVLIFMKNEYAKDQHEAYLAAEEDYHRARYRERNWI